MSAKNLCSSVHHFNQPVDKLPENLIYLNFGGCQPVDNSTVDNSPVDKLPESLIHLGNSPWWMSTCVDNLPENYIDENQSPYFQDEILITKSHNDDNYYSKSKKNESIVKNNQYQSNRVTKFIVWFLKKYVGIHFYY